MGRSAQLSGRLDLTEEEHVHDNPRATEEEQEQAQTGRMVEEEEQRSGYASPDDADVEPDEE